MSWSGFKSSAAYDYKTNIVGKDKNYYLKAYTADAKTYPSNQKYRAKNSIIGDWTMNFTHYHKKNIQNKQTEKILHWIYSGQIQYLQKVRKKRIP